MTQYKKFLITLTISSVFFCIMGFIYHKISASITTQLQIRVDFNDEATTHNILSKMQNIDYHIHILRLNHQNYLSPNFRFNNNDQSITSVGFKTEIMTKFHSYITTEYNNLNQNSPLITNFQNFISDNRILNTFNKSLIFNIDKLEQTPFFNIQVTSPLSIKQTKLIVNKTLNNNYDGLLTQYSKDYFSMVKEKINNIEELYKISKNLNPNMVKILNHVKNLIFLYENSSSTLINSKIFKHNYNDILTFSAMSSLKLTLSLFFIFGLVFGAFVYIIRKFIISNMSDTD